jgi:hypothetical protein
MFGHCVASSCCHQHDDDDGRGALDYVCYALFHITSNSPFVEWKLAHLTVDTHSDSGIEASVEAFVEDKVSQAWEILHKRKPQMNLR